MLYDFGPRLLRLRREKRLTQQALVDRAKALDPNLHLSDSVLGKYENDRAIPRLTEASAIADVLDVSLDYLTSGESYRCLSLKDLSEEQYQLLFDLVAYLRQQNVAPVNPNPKKQPTPKEAMLIAKVISEILGK